MLGRRLNTVERPYPCPQCGGRGPMDVYETAARWRLCGHQRGLPELPNQKPPKHLYRKKKGETRMSDREA